MQSKDDWWSRDKLQHVLACFLITLLVYCILRRASHRVLRKWSVPLAAIVSLAAGAAKEAGDEVGVWESAGGSVKDAVADALGVTIACLLLLICKRRKVEEEVVGRDLAAASMV